MCNASMNLPVQYGDDDSYAVQASYQQQPAQAQAIGYSQGNELAAGGYGGDQSAAGFDLSSVQLPPPNMSCFRGASVGQGETRYLVHNEPAIHKTIELNYNLTKTVVKENTTHHQHNRNVYYNVNRNYNHLVRVVNNNNNYHHHLINNIIRVNDIHHQRVEQVAGGSKNFSDYKQTQRIEQGGCRRGDGSCAGGAGGYQSPVNAGYGAGYYQGQSYSYGSPQY